MKPQPRARLRSLLRVLSALLAVLLLLLSWAWWSMARMPGTSFAGELPPLTAAQRAVADELRAHVATLAGSIGERNVTMPGRLAAAAEHIAATFAAAGYQVERQGFVARHVKCENLIVERRGSSQANEIVLVGAHYDSVGGCPGANDNGSGTAALLALAQRWSTRRAARTVRFVAWTNEEPPHFKTADMGSLVHARACRQRGDQIVAALSLETMGCYSTAAGSQHYPIPFGLFYPSRGDFIAFVSNQDNGDLVRRCVGQFRTTTPFPCEGGALPGFLPGVGWSDHWSYWQAGYPALMVTDTAPFRFTDYHHASDTVDKVDCERLARVLDGVDAVVGDLAAH